MRYGSVCSGIESASVAWEPLGWSAAWFSEVEPFPSAVLAHRWPSVANLGDMTQLPTLIAAGLVEAPDILVGGTPCQAFSVAGMRKGLDDERGQLTIKYVEVANEIDKQRPSGSECIAVWENVPGVLSSKDNAFGCFLSALVGEDDPLEPAGKKWGNAGIVYGPQRVAAWRVLDAQYFGVAQRRRRVFVVASARKGFDPAAVLFESESLRRDTPPSREAGQAASGYAGGGSPFDMQAFGKYGTGDTASTLKQRDYKDATDLVVHGTQDPLVLENKTFPLGRNGGRENVIIIDRAAFNQGVNAQYKPHIGATDVMDSLVARSQVRRLTPVECERLQGFPDSHTAIPWRKKPAADCPDGPRYKAIGNSKAVPVIRWVGMRIKKNT